MYPHINEFIELLHRKHISSFLVTNAQFPDAIKNLQPVTQLYVSIDASTKEALKAVDRPLFSDFWDRYQASLRYIGEKKQRTVYRLTLVKSYNMNEVAEYSKLIAVGKPTFIEIKGVTFTNQHRSNMTMKDVPWHYEVKEFADAICRYAGENAIGRQNENNTVNTVSDEKYDAADTSTYAQTNDENDISIPSTLDSKLTVPINQQSSTTTPALPYGFDMDEDDADNNDDNDNGDTTAVDSYTETHENAYDEEMPDMYSNVSPTNSPVSVHFDDHIENNHDIENEHDSNVEDSSVIVSSGQEQQHQEDLEYQQRRQQILQSLSATDSIYEPSIIHTLRDAMQMTMSPNDVIEHLSKNCRGIAEYCNLLIQMIDELQTDSDSDNNNIDIDVDSTILHCIHELFVEYMHKNPQHFIEEHRKQYDTHADESDDTGDMTPFNDDIKNALLAFMSSSNPLMPQSDNKDINEWSTSIQQLAKQYPSFHELLQFYIHNDTTNGVSNRNHDRIVHDDKSKHDINKNSIEQQSNELYNLLQQLLNAVSSSDKPAYEMCMGRLITWLIKTSADEDSGSVHTRMAADTHDNSTDTSSQLEQRIWLLSYILQHLMHDDSYTQSTASTSTSNNSSIATALYESIIERIFDHKKLSVTIKKQIIHILLIPIIQSSSSTSYQQYLHNTVQMIDICLDTIQQHHNEKSHDKHTYMNMVQRIYHLYVSSESSQTLSPSAPPLLLLRNTHVLQELLTELIWYKDRLNNSTVSNAIQLLSIAVSSNESQRTDMLQTLRLVHDTCNNSVEKQLPHTALNTLKQYVHMPIISYYTMQWITYLFTTDDDIHDITLQLSYKHLLIYYITLLSSILTQHNGVDMHRTMLYNGMETIIKHHIKRIQYESSSLLIQHILLLYVQMIHGGVIIHDVIKSLINNILPILDRSHVRYLYRTLSESIGNSETWSTEWKSLYDELQKSPYVKKAIMTARGVGVGIGIT